MSASSKDPLVFDAKMATRLEKLYASPQVVAQRVKFRELLAARPGEVGLDVGCGVGLLSCELAREVSPGGRIIALDNSPDMLQATQVRLGKEDLGHCVETRLGEATSLDLADESVDFVVGVQVYSYVQEVERAIGEAARVLRKGGRLAILETDWGMCIYESRDPALSRRIIDGRAAHFAHPYLPRRLHRLFRDAGLSLTRSGVHPMMETHYDPDSFGAGMVTIARDAAIRYGGINAADADAWVADIQSRKDPGEYFFCTNRLIFVATKN